MSPEVLIYIQTVKKYLKTNKEAREYFLAESDEELFFKHLAEISQKNFEKDGEVMLNKEQFELLKSTVRAIKISTNNDENIDTDENIFMNIKGFGKICLN
jgi:hypothetical protein